MLKRTVTSIFVPPFSKQMPSIHLPSPPPKSTHCEQFNDIPTRGPHPKGFNDSVNKAHPWLQMCVDFSPPLHHKAQKAAFKPSFHNSFSLKKVLNTSYAHFGKCPQVEGSKHISRSPTTPRQSGSRLEAILPSQKKTLCIAICLSWLCLVVCIHTIELYILLFSQNIIAEASSSFCFLYFLVCPFVPVWWCAVAQIPGRSWPFHCCWALKTKNRQLQSFRTCAFSTLMACFQV